MKNGAAPISLAGSQLGNTRHVCALFNSDDEEYRVLLPFIKDGFTCGDKAIHVVNPNQHDDHLQRLAAGGIDTAAAQRAGQFEIRTNTDAYLRDGRFDPRSDAAGIRATRQRQREPRVSAQSDRLPNGLGGRGSNPRRRAH